MCMEKNVGGADRIIRVVVALILFGLGILTVGWVSWALSIIALISLLTAIFGWCGLYTLLKINTSKAKTAPAVAEKVAGAVTSAVKPKKKAKKKAGKKKKK